MVGRGCEWEGWVRESKRTGVVRILQVPLFQTSKLVKTVVSVNDDF